MNYAIKNQILFDLERSIEIHENDIKNKEKSDGDKEWNIKWLDRYNQAIKIIKKIEVSDE